MSAASAWHSPTALNLNNVRPDVLEGAVKYRLRAMTCSIDGASQETYQRYRVRGDFDRVIANIRRINEWKRQYDTALPDLHWQFIVFGHNQHELPAARDLAAELGMRFSAKLSWDDDVSPPDAAALRQTLGAASRAEYQDAHGEDYMQDICHQLWDQPQINWDGKLLGCCRNFWGDFGANAFRDGLAASVNGPRIAHARAMLRGRAEPRADISCTDCSIYQAMRANGRYLRRADIAAGQVLRFSERVAQLPSTLAQRLPRVMAALVAAIHVFPYRTATDADGRDKPHRR